MNEGSNGWPHRAAPAPARGEGGDKREDVEVLPYSLSRRLTRTGDVLLFSGVGFVSGRIKSLTNSNKSHAEIVQWNLDLLMSAGAVGVGTDYRRLSSIIGEYPRIDVYRLALGVPLSMDAVMRAMLNHQGKGYDFKDIAIIDLKTRLGLNQDLPDLPEDADKFICSQYVSYCYRAGGVDLVEHKPDKLTTPADLEDSPYLEYQFSFAADSRLGGKDDYGNKDGGAE